MGKTVSKRGQSVDFDLMRIHQSLSNMDAPSVVVQRQASIEDRIQQRRIQRQNLRNKKREQEQASNVQESLPISQDSVSQDSVVIDDQEQKAPISRRPKKSESDANEQ